jgi:sialic acid synthase SpsE
MSYRPPYGIEEKLVNKIRIVAEVGSTHMGKMDYAKEAVDRCLEAGFDAIKFQLFPNTKPWVGTGNVWLPPDMYLEIAEYSKEQGLDCTASVFDSESFEFLLKQRPPFIKFAYSQKDRTPWIEACDLEGIEPIVSCDVMTDHLVPDSATKLFCLPQYPVYSRISFEGLFPRFHGFSDHTLGYEQTLESVLEGARLVEKHVQLNKSDITCPDSYFALRPAEFVGMCSAIRRLHIERIS